MSINQGTLTPPAELEPFVGRRPVRILSGWMAPEEAQQYVATSIMESQDEFLQGVTTANINRENVSRRAAGDLSSAEVEGDRSLLDAASSAPMLQTMLTGLQYHVSWTDLRKVVAVQKIVHLDYAKGRIDKAAASEAELVELCIPTSSEVLQHQLTMNPQADGRGYRLISPNSNLRLGSMFFDPNEGVLKIPVHFGSPFVSVAHLGDRYIMTNGYHRAVALATRGVTVIPAVVTEISAYPFQGGPMLPFLEPEVAFSASAPTIVDYYDDAITMALTHKWCRKVAAVHSTEFDVPI